MNMEKGLILEKVEAAVTGRGCFIVDVAVSKDNDVILTIEKEVGTVDLDDCRSINDAFLDAFDRDVEDYSLTVTSAGLDQPFKILRQYLKAIGSLVEVKLKGGRKLVGVLTEADESGIKLRYSQKMTVEGKKKKEIVDTEESLPFEAINSTVPHIVFSK